MMVSYLITFFTHSGAVGYRRKLAKHNMYAEVMPVPRKVSSSCGVALKLNEDNDQTPDITDEVEAIYIIENNDYKSIYNSK